MLRWRWKWLGNGYPSRRRSIVLIDFDVPGRQLLSLLLLRSRVLNELTLLAGELEDLVQVREHGVGESQRSIGLVGDEFRWPRIDDPHWTIVFLDWCRHVMIRVIAVS